MVFRFQEITEVEVINFYCEKETETRACILTGYPFRRYLAEIRMTSHEVPKSTNKKPALAAPRGLLLPSQITIIKIDSEGIGNES